MAPSIIPTCPRCRSTDTKKHGMQCGKIRRVCNGCNKCFTERSSEIQQLKKILNAIQRIKIETPNIPAEYLRWTEELARYFIEKIKRMEKLHQG